MFLRHKKQAEKKKKPMKNTRFGLVMAALAG
jgi:hypothetical protein